MTSGIDLPRTQGTPPSPCTPPTASLPSCTNSCQTNHHSDCHVWLLPPCTTTTTAHHCSAPPPLTTTTITTTTTARHQQLCVCSLHALPGTITTIGNGLPVYQVGSGDAAVLVCYDIFGFDFKQAGALALETAVRGDSCALCVPCVCRVQHFLHLCWLHWPLTLWACCWHCCNSVSVCGTTTHRCSRWRIGWLRKGG